MSASKKVDVTATLRSFPLPLDFPLSRLRERVGVRASRSEALHSARSSPSPAAFPLPFRERVSASLLARLRAGGKCFRLDSLGHDVDLHFVGDVGKIFRDAEIGALQRRGRIETCRRRL